jgi:hypothetical protein
LIRPPLSLYSDFDADQDDPLIEAANLHPPAARPPL